MAKKPRKPGRQTINTMVRDDPEKLRRYRQRVDTAIKKMDDLGRGARAKCSFDMRIAAGRISDLLNHKCISTVDLTVVEGWLEQHQATDA